MIKGLIEYRISKLRKQHCMFRADMEKYRSTSNTFRYFIKIAIFNYNDGGYRTEKEV